MEKNSKFDISSSGLHILAMIFMLCDHLWAALFPSAEWLTCAGRLAFPIFAFMITEGYVHTHDLRRYMLRLLFWAAASEIPFNLMYAGSVIYPYHQNVLWTFLIGLLLIAFTERCRAHFSSAAAVILTILLAAAGYIVGYATMVDYYGAGVLMILAFYFFRTPDLKNRLILFVCLYILNVELLGGYFYSFELLGHNVEFPQQGFALLSLIPIWLYRGRQGTHSKAFRYFCYAFYPAHMLILYVIRSMIV